MVTNIASVYYSMCIEQYYLRSSKVSLVGTKNHQTGATGFFFVSGIQNSGALCHLKVHLYVA